MSDEAGGKKTISEPQEGDTCKPAVPSGETSYEWFSGTVDYDLLREFVRLDREGKLKR
jgi:hypothetical protein